MKKMISESSAILLYGPYFNFKEKKIVWWIVYNKNGKQIKIACPSKLKFLNHIDNLTTVPLTTIKD